MTAMTVIENDLTQTGMRFPEDCSLSEWTAIGHRLLKFDDSYTWAIGDWAAFGIKQYGKLKEFCIANRLQYQTIANYAYTAASIEVSRRRESLSYSHHAEVAPLPAKEQKKWLDEAQSEQLSVAELRRRIRESKPGGDALISDGPALRTIGTKFDEVKSFLLNREPDFWDDERKQVWKERLRPMVEFYEKL